MKSDSRIAHPSAICCLLVAATAVLAVGCAGLGSKPELEQGPDAEVTYDGLVRVQRSRMQRAWMKPGADISQYSKFVVAEPVFRFKKVRGGAASGRVRRGQTGFYITEANRKRLAQEVGAVFRDELAGSKYFQRVDEAGPDVLLLEGAMLDIVSRVPPVVPGRSDVFLDSVGAATIVLQLADSESGEVLARAADRRAAQTAGGTATWSSPVTTWSEVRRLARRWARILTSRLDQLHELGAIGEADATN
jgi:hypothetical protein